MSAIRIKTLLGAALVLIAQGVYAHDAGQSDDEHEQRKKMAEQQEARQSWEGFMNKVKGQSADKKKEAHESHGEHGHADH